jgi:hypothetical protein
MVGEEMCGKKAEHHTAPRNANTVGEIDLSEGNDMRMVNFDQCVRENGEVVTTPTERKSPLALGRGRDQKTAKEEVFYP